MNAFTKEDFNQLFRISVFKALETKIHGNHSGQKEGKGKHQSEAVLTKADGVREGNGNREQPGKKAEE